MARSFESTRDNNIKATPSEAIVMGLSQDGGLFVPRDLSTIKLSTEDMKDAGFNQIAKQIIGLFFNDFSEEQLNESVNGAYDEKFDSKEIVPVVKVGDTFIMELFHGKTIAFKDIALSILPYLMKNAEKNCNSTEEIIILTATSGDTGKAALEGFKDIEGIRIVVFYPEHGVSQVQRLQMITQEGGNTHVVAIDGNFDDAQSAVKVILNDEIMRAGLKAKNIKFSSANSINIGRLIPQIAYYFSTYEKLVRDGEINRGDRINFVVPTGNFGNILAGYFAKQIGLPINKLICAANENNILRDFINTGIYDTNRPFIKTMSPSMDILISSNLERLLYYLSDCDNDYIAGLMKDLATGKKYEVKDSIKEKLKEEFWSSYCNEEETMEAIRRVFQTYGYVMDTHTAVAYKTYEDYIRATQDRTKTVVLSTASPFKFPGSVYSAIYGPSDKDELALMEELSERTGLLIPEVVNGLGDKKVLHKRTCKPGTMADEIMAIISEDQND
ncbi:MAG: threonine synthase [Eubacteriales bacterium]|nr:threonine synthase [Eubacteriales bacterium]